MVSLAFVIAFVVSAIAMLIGIVMLSEISDGMAQTFGEPLLVNETNSTEFTNTTPITHSYAEQITAQTHTGDLLYTTIPNISLSSGEFTAGNKYLVMFRADIKGSSASDENYAIKSLHGSTDFVGSEKIWKHKTNGDEFQYIWFTVWTAVSGEGLTMQFRNVDDSTETVEADNITITAIELENFIEDEDWFFDVRTTDDVLQCTPFHVTKCNPVGLWTQTNPSITLTTNGSDDWLVMATSLMNPESPTEFQVVDLVQSRINLDDTTLAPLMRKASDTANDLTRQIHFLTRVYTPSASSHTFENEASFINVDNIAIPPSIREHSQIFAINLDKFEYHTDNYNPTPFVSENNIYTVLASGLPFFTSVIGFGNGAFESNTMTVDSPSTEDTFIIGFNIMEHERNGGGSFRQRMQVDDGSGVNFTLDHEQKEGYKDTPLTQTDHTQGCSFNPIPNPADCVSTILYTAYATGVNADHNRWAVFTMQDLTTSYPLNNGVVDVDVDSLMNVATSQNTINDSQLVAISMSAKTFEFASQVPQEFAQSSNIALTVIGVFPIVLFFALFSILSGRGVE